MFEIHRNLMHEITYEIILQFIPSHEYQKLDLSYDIFILDSIPISGSLPSEVIVAQNLSF